MNKYKEVLDILNNRNSCVSSRFLARELDCDHKTVINILGFLQNLGDFITIEEKIEQWAVTTSGEEFLKSFNSNENNENKKWFEFLSKLKEGDVKEDLVQECVKLDYVQPMDMSKNRDCNYFEIKRGKEFKHDIKIENDVTSELLNSGDWKNIYLAPYPYDDMGPVPEGGRHNYVKYLCTLSRTALFEMGFKEILAHNWTVSTNTSLNTEYDILSVKPEDDTLITVNVSPEFSAQMHCLNNEAAACQQILKILTTSLFKCFSIGKAFQNIEDDPLNMQESLKIEILMCDYDLRFSDLMGIIELFFDKIEIGSIDFKPGYTHFTEPSLDVIIYHGELDKWLVIGNAGMIRKEELRKFALNENLSVLRWSFSIELLAMIKLELTDMQDVLQTML